jgi:ABC-type antimicrobial peptide transport system permease subunit
MKIVSARILELIILVLVAAGIFNTLFVSVMERIREFGIMMAIGFGPATLFSLVMCESLWLGLTGLLLAVGVTAGPYYYLATTGLDAAALVGNGGGEVAGVALSTVIHVDIYPENALMIAAAVLLATLLSGIYPAWRAGRVVPVESIRLV